VSRFPRPHHRCACRGVCAPVSRAHPYERSVRPSTTRPGGRRNRDLSGGRRTRKCRRLTAVIPEPLEVAVCWDRRLPLLHRPRASRLRGVAGLRVVVAGRREPLRRAHRLRRHAAAIETARRARTRGGGSRSGVRHAVHRGPSGREVADDETDERSPGSRVRDAREYERGRCCTGAAARGDPSRGHDGDESYSPTDHGGHPPRKRRPLRALVMMPWIRPLRSSHTVSRVVSGHARCAQTQAWAA
jgi:hypothetical protein